MIKGPTDADHYRVKVGNWGERWYTDPLPATKHIEASDATFPSISTVKKASGQDWSFVSLKRVADAEPERLHQIADLPGPERYDAITSINKRGLGRAAERGTNVHLYAESLLRGTQPPLMTEGYPGWNYIKAVDDFFSTYNPKLYAAEYPVFHRTLNGVGYGGTPDGIVEIGGELYGIDWKTRTETSDHGAYPEEAAQIAAGAFAEYMIVEDADGNAVRQPVPQLAGGLIVSIRPDGCRVFPLDLAVAWDHWTAMHAWWVARRTEKVSIGKPWAPGKRQSEAKPKRIEPPTVTATVAPDEGDPVTDVDDIRTRYLALDPAARAWVDGKRAEALAAGCDFHLKDHYTQRRLAIMDGLCVLAVAEMDDDAVRALVRFATTDDAMEWPTIPAGACVGSMNAGQADTFANAARLLTGGLVGLAISEDGPKLTGVG